MSEPSNNNMQFLASFLLGAVAMYLIIIAFRALLFDKNDFTVEKIPTGALLNPFMINHTNVAPPEVTLSTCTTKFPNNCFTSATTAHAAFPCPETEDCPVEPFGTITIGSTVNSPISDMLGLYNDALNLDTVDDDRIIELSNIILRGGCYLATELEDVAGTGVTCVSAQSTLKNKGINLSNVHMNLLYDTCIHNATADTLTGTLPESISFTSAAMNCPTYST